MKFFFYDVTSQINITLICTNRGLPTLKRFYNNVKLSSYRRKVSKYVSIYVTRDFSCAIHDDSANNQPIILQSIVMCLCEILCEVLL